MQIEVCDFCGRERNIKDGFVKVSGEKVEHSYLLCKSCLETLVDTFKTRRESTRIAINEKLGTRY